MNPPHRDAPPPAPVIERIGEDGMVYVETGGKASWEDKQRSRSYPHSLDLLLGALSILVLWLSVPLLILSLVMKTLGQPGPWGALCIYALVALVCSLVLTLCISLTKRCPLCHGTPLHSRQCPKHRLADQWPLLTHRATTALRILLTLSFRCMYCGTPFRLFKRSSRQR